MAVDDPGRYSGQGVPTAATPEVHTHIHSRAAISQSGVALPDPQRHPLPKLIISRTRGETLSTLRCACLTSICMKDHLSLNLFLFPRFERELLGGAGAGHLLGGGGERGVHGARSLRGRGHRRRRRNQQGHDQVSRRQFSQRSLVMVQDNDQRA